MGLCSNSSCRRDGPSKKSNTGLNPPAQQLIETGTGIRYSQKHHKRYQDIITSNKVISEQENIGITFICNRQAGRKIGSNKLLG